MKRPLPVAFRACALPSRKGEVDAAMRDAETLLDESAAPRRVQVAGPFPLHIGSASERDAHRQSWQK